MLPYKIKNKLEAPILGDLRFGGSISEQMEGFFTERVRSDFARGTILAEAEIQFSKRDDDATAVGYWRGEFWGKWIISACRAARYERDEKLKQTILDSALRIISTADEDGYIGTYADKTNVLAPDPRLTRPVVGWDCVWNWNLWCRKYTLWALIEVYQLTEDERILTAAKRFTDQYISMLDALGLHPGDTGTFNGLPASSILKPMLILYRITEDKKYLDFSLLIASDWEKSDGHIPNLIANALEMKPVHTWYPEPQKWAKAYEMMSCLDGLLELYRVTGVEKYLTVVKNMYTLLKEHEGNQVLSVGFNDIFANAARYQNSISEPCDVIHWMRICYELLCLTGDAKYADTFEAAYYNPLLGSARADGRWGARGARSSGQHMYAHGQVTMEHQHCCINNMPRGFLNAVDIAAMRDGDTIVVNLYNEFSGMLGDDLINVSGDLFGSGRVTVEIDAASAASVRLRYPHWSMKLRLNGLATEAQTLIDGKRVEGIGIYSEHHLQKGKNSFTLEFDMTPRLIVFDGELEHFPKNDFRIARYLSDDLTENEMSFDRCAKLMRGPLLLCKSKLVGCTEEEMFGSDTIDPQKLSSAVCEVTPIESDRVRAAYDVKLRDRAGNTLLETKMCDYATGSNLEGDPRLFTIWLTKHRAVPTKN